MADRNGTGKCRTKISGRRSVEEPNESLAFAITGGIGGGVGKKFDSKTGRRWPRKASFDGRVDNTANCRNRRRGSGGSQGRIHGDSQSAVRVNGVAENRVKMRAALNPNAG